MKIYIRDISAVAGPSARFSITLAEDNGEPVLTERGWLIDRLRRVQGPRSKTRFGMYYKISELSPAWLEKLTAVLSGMKSIQEILGPEIPTVEGAEFSRAEKYDEEGEVS